MDPASPARPMSEVYAEGRRMAREGYGWQDLVVRLPIGETTARMLVTEAEYRRLALRRTDKP